MKIVILDGIAVNPGDLDYSVFAPYGDTTIYDRTPLELAPERAAGADIIFTNKTPINRAVLEACPNLRWIGIFATGYNHIDLEACRERGVVVSNVPDYSSDGVAQLTFAFILRYFSKVEEHNQKVHDGGWTTCPDFSFTCAPVWELAGKTIGIIGFGSIGKTVARIAHAFGMRILTYTRTPRPCPEYDYVTHCSLEELLRQSDIVSLHLPLSPQTQKLMNRETIGMMKDGAMLVNTSRGSLVDEVAAAEALRSGKLGQLSADVVSVEPILADNPLLSAPNCVITPHIGWAAYETRKRLLDMSIYSMEQFLKGEPIYVVS